MKKIAFIISVLVSLQSFSQNVETFDASKYRQFLGLKGASVKEEADFQTTGIAATSATTGAMTVNMTSSVITITPTGNCTFNASGGVAGQRVTFVITTSGTTTRTLTFGTNFKTVGTLATGTTTNKIFTISFVYNGTLWLEAGRTAAM